MRTDQEKLLAQLEEELEQSRELVRAQQQLLQVLIICLKCTCVHLVSKIIQSRFFSCDIHHCRKLRVHEFFHSLTDTVYVTKQKIFLADL